MTREEFGSHDEHARALIDRVATTGLVDRRERLAALNSGAGGPQVPGPYDVLAHQIAVDSARVTDTQMADVLRAAGSEKGAFEIVLAASIGAGLRRWDAAANAIREAGDATP